MPQIRPDLKNGYDAICYQGEQFFRRHPAVPLAGMTFTHPEKGEVPIEIDRETLAAQGVLYVADPALREALLEQGVEVYPTKEAVELLGHHWNPKTKRLNWGFSGFASGGVNRATGKFFSYYEEAEDLNILYDHLLARGEAPGLAIDGGVSAGFLALNSIIAMSANVPTLGFIPREGLASVGLRTHMIVAGDTYQDREALVGSAPDILVCAGGRNGTVRECLRAVKYGVAVIILSHDKYPDDSLPKTFQRYQSLRKAVGDKRLVVCQSFETITECVDQITRVDVRASRARRLKAVTRSLLNA